MAKKRSIWKSIGIVVGILVLVLMIATVVAGVYFTRISKEYRIFRVSGQAIGDCQPGAIVVASQDFDHPLCQDDLVIFQELRDSRSVEVMGIVKALPGAGAKEGYYLIERPGDRERLVPIEEVDWKVVEKIR